MPVNGER
jgi:hypothetical protein